MSQAPGTIIFLIAAALLAAPILLLYYHRNLNKFRNEIDTFLKTRQLTFLRTREAKKTDWENSPFNKPPLFSVSIGSVGLGARSMRISKVQYLIIETTQKQRIWLEITTTFLCKPALVFKNELVPPPVRKRDDTFKYDCPACAYPISEKEDICPDCGLHLNQELNT